MADEVRKRPTCEGCEYWESIDGSEGICRVNPPRIIMDGDPDGFEDAPLGKWPRTGKNDWCGKHDGFKSWLKYLWRD